MILSILSFIFVLGLLIFVHELGHFLVAKRCGIRVETFSLGFPPKMFGFRRGDTEYCISWIPLGGYVKMSGEKPDEEDVHGRPYEFMSKPIWQRALVIFAGPAMNYLLAIVLLAGVFLFWGERIEDKSSKIGLVIADEPAEAAGLKAGDVMIAVNDSSVSTFAEMYNQVTANPGKEVRLTWLRGVDTMSTLVTTRVDTMLNLQGEIIEVGKIGVGRASDQKVYGFFGALGEGFTRTNDYVGEIILFLKNIFTGAVSSKLIGGPVFIAQAASEAARQGLMSILLLAGVLSVNLCVVNLLPIPVLDGGQLVFLAIEKIKGSPVSMKGRAIAQQIGLVFLLIFIIFVTKNDIWRISTFGW